MERAVGLSDYRSTGGNRGCIERRGLRGLTLAARIFELSYPNAFAISSKHSLWVVSTVFAFSDRAEHGP